MGQLYYQVYNLQQLSSLTSTRLQVVDTHFFHSPVTQVFLVLYPGSGVIGMHTLKPHYSRHLLPGQSDMLMYNCSVLIPSLSPLLQLSSVS